MKTTLKILNLAIVSFMLIISCTKSDDSNIKDEEQENPKDSIEVTEIDVQVLLPNESTIDISTAKLISLSEEFDVFSDGSSKVLLNADGRVLTLLTNSNDEIILMGFITESNTQISIKSTIEVSFYLALGTVFLPEEVKQQYFDEFDTFPGLDEIITTTTSKFIENSAYFESTEFSLLIEQKLNELTDNKTTINTNTNKGISADGKDIRSGIQLREDDIFSFSLINSYRRRSHGFIYKTEITPEDGNVQTLISSISTENPAPFKDVEIKSTQAIREVLGVIADFGSGTGLNFAKTEAGPNTLEIMDGEEEVLYKCRVIGTAIGEINNGTLSNLEKEKLDELIYRTLAFEVVLPVFLDAAGHSKLLQGLDETKFELFAAQVQIIASSIPAAEDAIKQGDYKTALTEVLKSYYNNALGAQATDLLSALFEGIVAAGVQVNTDYFVQNSANASKITNGVAKFLNRADIFLKFVDYGRILYANTNSNYLEEWDVIASNNKVSITPEETIAIQGEEKTFKAIIKDGDLAAGQSYEYRWSTSGNYGVLRNELGKEGTSFTSSREEVTYFSSNTIELPEEAQDEISVEVFIKEGQNLIRVNDANAVVNVKPLGFEIRPDGITIQGGNQLTLNLRRTDQTNPIENSTQDYRIVWDTPAEFGLFNGSASNITKINDNEIVYEALEKERDGTEQITASIYARRKGTSDEYAFVDKISASIEIKNDPNCEISYESLVPVVRFPEVPRSQCETTAYSGRVFIYVPYDENATSYNVEWTETYTGWNNTYFDNRRNNLSWTNESFDTAIITKDGNVFEVYSGLGNGISCARPSAFLNQLIERLNSTSGFATVTICYD
ncbi:hypothetical protein ACKGJY_09905 [Hyunsoonleella sp. 2307UL5-6]|uniref:hypothetical protein n=1 Tax=Hyunsoonleella sp. 2307UL5-6 TaxID=3384768 RepID=UPI0039BD370B